MKTGIVFWATARSADIVTLARHVEQLGFESLWLVESTFGLPPVKPAIAWPGAGDTSPVAPKIIGAFGGETRGVFQRSSVGTARTPTGPPS